MVSAAERRMQKKSPVLSDLRLRKKWQLTPIYPVSVELKESCLTNYTTIQLNVELLMNKTLSSQVNCKTNFPLGRTISLCWDFLHRFHMPFAVLYRADNYLVQLDSGTVLRFALTSLAMDLVNALWKSRFPQCLCFCFFILFFEVSQKNKPFRL